jgi:outer membrane usher protein
MASATYRRGFSDAFTGEMHVEASPRASMGGVGATVAVADFGVLNGASAVSHSDRGVGTRYQLGFESRTPRLSYGAIAELISDDFVSVGTAGSDLRPPRLTVQAFAGIPFKIGSLGLSYILRDSRGQADVEFLGASASVRLGRWGALNLTGRKSLRGPAADALLLSFTKPLGAATSLSIGGELGQSDLLRLSLQKNLPAGEGLGYRAAAQLGAVDRLDGSLSYQTDFGTYGLDLSWVDSQAGVRMTASGGIGIMGDRVFASRKLTQSFATVKVGDYPGVHVYADNQQVGTTDASGMAVIPSLRPFEKNQVRIDVADLPIDSQIDASEKIVRPYDRSGVALEFGVRPSHGAIVTLVRKGEQPVPAGATVRLNGSTGEFLVAPGGETYLTGLGATTRGVATWETGSCTFHVSYPEHAEPQPRLGPLPCRENHS